ncbi:hypothetical protein MLD38_037225 [Melastoma candidum]|uniref:Uncharacterized protein n=1 Tax=Melastoma candidum TaxID=119954 RepID=A0ACB9LLP4_9MYRT|nr:hypothetical protein MLD38_037225 [Melastoma candidum]
MAEAARRMPFLETFEYCFGNFNKHTLMSIGMNCPSLTTFIFGNGGKGQCIRDADCGAFAIAKYMPGLRRLSLFGNRLTNKGLGAILDGCPQLQSLDLRDCCNIVLKSSDLEKKCERIKDMRWPQVATASGSNGYDLSFDPLDRCSKYNYLGDSSDYSDEHSVYDYEGNTYNHCDFYGFRFFSSIDQRCVLLINLCRPSVPKLKKVHDFTLRCGVSLSDQEVAKHLVYALVSEPDASPGNVSYARTVFVGIRDPTNVFTWNAMIKGYSESETPSSAVEFYRESKVEIAHKVFDAMLYRDLVAWNTVINGFASNGMPNEALMLFKKMSSDGVAPDGFTVVSVLTACAEMGALALGRRIHVYMVKIGLIENLHASNSLLDLYAKSGCVCEARKVFNEMSVRNVVSWMCLIAGLAVNGIGFEALELFKEMEREGLVPSQITFVGVLCACSHCGIVDQGFEYFRRMQEEFGIVPLIEHHGCMVDLLSRAGLVQRAFNYIKSMKMRPNAVIWRTLLSACTTHGHLTLAEVVRAELA